MLMTHPAAIPLPQTAPDREAVRREKPRILDTDWLLLTRLRAGIAAAVDEAAEGETAVDLGCGSQPYAALFRAAGVHYIPADLDGGAGVLPISAEGEVPLPAGTVDLVVSFQVLEHVRDVQAYLAEARRLLAPGGRLLLSTHGNWLFHPHPEDHRRWTRMGLLGEIERAGFAIKRCTPILGPLAWTTILRTTGYAFALRKFGFVGRGVAKALALIANLRAMAEDRVTPEWVTADNACVYLVDACRP